jgi:hypothetical protein
MNLTRNDLEAKSLEEVAGVMGEVGPNSAYDQLCRAEFLLRQTKLLERSALASEEAAKAAVETSKSTLRYTKYMFFSLLLMLASIIVSMLSAHASSASSGNQGMAGTTKYPSSVSFEHDLTKAKEAHPDKPSPSVSTRK